MSKYLPMMWFLMGIFGLILYLSQAGNRIVGGGLGIVALIIVAAVVRQKLIRKKEGYYVYKSGGAEDGFVIYDEGGKTIKLYFSRIKDTIYVPSDVKWEETMPEWAKEKKQEIVARIKKHVGTRLIGKSWTYEETDRQETLLRQS